MQEAAESWAKTLSFDEFQELQENMIQDGATEVPASTDAIMDLKVVRNLPTLAACLLYPACRIGSKYKPCAVFPQ